MTERATAPEVYSFIDVLRNKGLTELAGKRAAEEVRRAVVQPALLDLSARDLRSYSLARAVEACASSNWAAAGLELEASRTIAERIGSEPRGFYVPVDTWRPSQERRAVIEVADDAADLVGTTISPENFIDVLRPNLTVSAAGARTVSGLVGDTRIPRKTTTATAAWIANETTASTPTDSVYDAVTLSPKVLGAASTISRKALQQASPSMEQLVRDDIAGALAAKLDAAVFHGTGASGQPTGLAVVGSSDLAGEAVGGTNGARVDWDDIVSMERFVALANGLAGRPAYITTPSLIWVLKNRSRAVGGPDEPPTIIDPVYQPGLNGFPVFSTTSVRNDITKGTGEDLCAIFFGDWSSVIIGEWGALDILPDMFTDAGKGLVTLWGFMTVDVGFRNLKQFSRMLDSFATV